MKSYREFCIKPVKTERRKVENPIVVSTENNLNRIEIADYASMRQKLYSFTIAYKFKNKIEDLTLC